MAELDVLEAPGALEPRQRFNVTVVLSGVIVGLLVVVLAGAAVLGLHYWDASSQRTAALQVGAVAVPYHSYTPANYWTAGADGTVYSTSGTGFLQVLHTDGSQTQAYVSGPDGKRLMSLGLAVDATGTLYSAAPAAVVVFKTTGAIVRTQPLPAGWVAGSSLAVGPTGELFVSAHHPGNESQQSVLEYSSANGWTVVWTGAMALPGKDDVQVGADGSLYVRAQAYAGNSPSPGVFVIERVSTTGVHVIAEKSVRIQIASTGPFAVLAGGRVVLSGWGVARNGDWPPNAGQSGNYPQLVTLMPGLQSSQATLLVTQKGAAAGASGVASAGRIGAYYVDTGAGLSQVYTAKQAN